MKRISLLIALTFFVTLPLFGDNPCIENGPHYGSWNCLQQGGPAAGYVLSPATLQVNPGQTILPPGVSNLSFTNGSAYSWATYDCSTALDGYITNAVTYSFSSLIFSPTLPVTLWAPGTNVYTVESIATSSGSCPPITNILGNFKVVVSSTPDALFNIDFGAGTNSSKIGYGAIGDSPQDYWNHYPGSGQSSGSLAPLKSAEGYTSPVGLLVSNLVTAATDGSLDPMYGSFLTGGSTQLATVTITNLPVGTWNLYLYATNGNFEVLSGANSYGVQTTFDSPLANPLVWQAGVQFACFRNVLVTNGQALTVNLWSSNGVLPIISGIQIASTTHVPPISGLVSSGMSAWWKAESNTLDSIDSNNGVFMGNTNYAPGEVGSAFNFNGSSYVQVPDGPDLRFTNQMSEEAWVYMYDYSGNPNNDICDKFAALSLHANSYGLAVEGASAPTHRGYFVLADTNFVGHLVFTPNAIPLNQWVHLAGTYDGQTMRIYENGVLAGSLAMSSGIYPGTQPLSIGASINGNPYAFMHGRIDEVSLYKLALSDSEIAAIYDAGALGKISSMMQDSDYDGVSDLQEFIDRTDPNNPNSVLNLRLGYWRFDNTNTWVGDEGQLPLQTNNLVGVPSWDTNAVLIDNANPAILKYRDVETNGNANINLRNGSISFWFKPDWASTNMGGIGPQSEGRLIEVGSEGSTNGWWGLVIGSAGTNLYFGTQTNSTLTLSTNLSGVIAWQSNAWHQIVLTYSANNSAIYIDGQSVANGAGVAFYPGPDVRSQGFTIGSSAGTNQARGAFEDLQTFNYALGSADVISNYQAALQQDSDGNGLGDFWEVQNFGHLGVDPCDDPDHDGLSNAQEYENGTNPNQFDSVRLGYWQFNDPTNWLDFRGLPPSDMHGVIPVPSWAGDAARLASQFQSVLGYSGVRPNCSSVVTCPGGSVRFWFKPDWGSSPVDNGPGGAATLFEIGHESTDANYGWMGLTVDAAGTTLSFGAEGGGVQTNLVSIPLQFQAHNWYQVTLTYNPQQTCIYLDGQLMALGTGLTVYPTTNVVQQGFRLGSTWDGVQQANGAFDELETFNYALSPADVTASYSNAMSILAVDGLPAVMADSLGLRLDSMDTDCDGLPDAWELANGLNPLNPSDATPAALVQYAAGLGSMSPLAASTASRGSLFNIAFVSDATHPPGLSMSGAIVRGAVTGNVTNDAWNFCDMNSAYLQGIPILNASSNSSDAELYAFIGPCATGFIEPPDWNSIWIAPQSITSSSPDGSFVTNATWFNFNLNGFERGSTDTTFLRGYNLNAFDVYSWYSDFMGNELTPYPGYFLVQDTSSPYYNMFEQVTYANGVTTFNYVEDVSTGEFLQWWYNPLLQSGANCAGQNWLQYPYQFYYDSDWNPDGPYYDLTPSCQTALSSAFDECTSYARSLAGYLTTKGLGSSLQNSPPLGCAYCYVPPFNSVSHSVASLSGSDGAVWSFSGDPNHLGTNSEGGWFKKFYPDAGRTILLSGVPSGNYQVLVYFDTIGVTPVVGVNGNVATIVTNFDGSTYLSSSASTLSFAPITNLSEGLYPSAPAWAVTNKPGEGYLAINVSSPNVYDSEFDAHILGVQVVGLGGAGSLQIRPGSEAAYLNWNIAGATGSYSVSRSIGNSNSWVTIGTTTQNTYTDTNLTAGAVYYYMVTAHDKSGNPLNSSVASVVPFACLPPLPPRLDFMNQLDIPGTNGAYQFTYQTLLTNSDAVDPQGYPFVFKIDSVVSGSLMINGLPYNAGNCTITNGSTAVWTPPAMMLPVTVPAFRVYVYDGVNRSTNSVDVFIKRAPSLHLFGWGFNSSGNIGDGNIRAQSHGGVTWKLGVDHFYPFNEDQFAFQFAFADQANLGIVPNDPRWSIVVNASNSCTPPSQVLDLNSVSSVSSWNDFYGYQGVCAVTPDKHLWVWGELGGYLTGRPLVITSDGSVQIWNSDLIPSGSAQRPFTIVAPSPIPFIDPTTGAPMTGVVAAKDGFILKDDGSLWSLGCLWGVYGKLGRDPTQSPTDYGGWGGVGYAAVPGRIEIDGNNAATGIADGREFVGIYPAVAGESALAQCKDGSLWWWGELDDGATDPCNGSGDWWSTYILVDRSGSDPNWMPKRLTCMEIPGAAPIQQICASMNHYVFLRKDGSVSELGYIPSTDNVRTTCFDQLWCGLDITGEYSMTPVPVTSLPKNVTQICASWNSAAALTDNGDVWVWGHWANQTVVNAEKIGTLSDIVKIQAADQIILALDKYGKVWAVGQNETGMFGYTETAPDGEITWPWETGTQTFYTNAVRVSGIENAADIFLADCGDSQTPDAFAIGTAVQGKPSGLVAVGMDRQIQLSWTSFPNTSYYVIYRSRNPNSGYVKIGTSAVNSYIDQDPSLQNGQTYYYEVSAVVNGVESAQSWDAFATPYPAPGPVISLSASWSCHGTVLQWQAPTNIALSPVNSYQVLIGSLQLAELPAGSTNYYDNTAVAGSNPTYTVVARNSSGTASASASTAGTVPCAPAPFVNTNIYSPWLSAVADQNGGNDHMTLAWTGTTNGQWLFQPTEFDTFAGIQNVSSPTETVTWFCQMLSYADPVYDPVPNWLWSKFLANGVDTTSLLDTTKSVPARIAILVPALNQVLTDGVPISDLSFFAPVVQSGYYSDTWNGGPLRQATINLFNSAPQGSALVQLKRMLLDDCLGATYFTRGGNWGSQLSGFRVHYHTLQYVDGQKVEQVRQYDVNPAQLQYNHGRNYFDLENVPACVYTYSWPIPQGAVCWASVSALVNGQEGEISDEIGPRAANSQTEASAWAQNSGLRAIPGYQQVYLDWNDDVNAIDYSLYVSTDSNDTNSLLPGTGSWAPVPGAANLQINRFWQTGLSVNTTYYYMLVADDYFNGDVIAGTSAWATVTTMPAVTDYFSADAAAYDGMVLVEWTVPTNQDTVIPSPLNQTNWQFYVERKPASTDDSNYQLITDAGYGLAYLDSDVTDGNSYTYRVTAFDSAFDRFQAIAIAKGGTSTAITPAATNGLTLLQPVPGNGYVDLRWSPIRAAEFTVLHSLSPNGPFDAVDNLFSGSAYQNAQNTDRITGLQNGVMHYFQIAATTPTGFEIDSEVQGAMPLATLAPLPPNNFQGIVLSLTDSNVIALSWTAQTGASDYELFLQNQGVLTPVFSGSATSYSYNVPLSADPYAVFTFSVRSVSSQGAAGDFVTTSVTNQPPPVMSGVNQPVVLEIAGTNAGPLTVTGPTNLSLSADVNLPTVSQVNFYADGQLIGSASSAPYQFTWYHVPGTSDGSPHLVWAVAMVSSPPGYAPVLSGGSGTYTSQTIELQVNVQPQLGAYQTSVTDLQIPAPALPISLSRSYNSRNTNADPTSLAIGWTANWKTGSVKFSADPNSGWQGVSQAQLGWSLYYISESTPHYVTVSLPDGGSAGFGPQLPYNTDDTSGDLEQGDSVEVDFQSFGVNDGTLSSDGSLTEEYDILDPASDWTSLSLGGFNASQFTYTGSDGTIYTFGQRAGDGLTWLLTKTMDRNGNSLTYTYNGDNTLQSIENSCGRTVSFTYTSPQGGVTNIWVDDPIGVNHVVGYVISNSLLTQVLQLTNRSAGGYQTNFYSYGPASDPQNYNRLTDTYDVRGIRSVHNVYTDSDGDLLLQISPGKTNNYAFDPTTYDLTLTSSSSTATNTAVINSDASGAISGATQPVSGTTPGDIPAGQVSYDSQGNLVGQTDADGNTKTYTYDDLNRLVGQSDENGNSTSTELNSYGQPTTSTDANGNQTLYAYDNNGNQTSVRDPSGTSTSYTYSTPVSVGGAYLSAMRTSQSQIAPFVPYTIVSLNSYNTTGPILGDLSWATNEWRDANGNVVGTPVITSYQYDANGNCTAESKQRTVNGGIQYITTSYTRDAQNRVVMRVVSAYGAQSMAPQTNTTTYDPLGKQLTSTDAAGRTTTNVYDFNENVIETAYPDGTVSRTTYDGFGRQQYVQDRAVPNGQSSTAPATLSFYDASGRVTNSLRLANVTLTKSSESAGSDFNGLPSAVAYKMTASNPGAILYSNLTFYDAVGQVQYSVDAHGAVTENRYDAAGHKTNMLVYTQNSYSGSLPPGGTVQNTVYTYDANGNQISVTDGNGNSTTSVYDGANRVIQTIYPAVNGTASQFAYYDGLGRQIQQTDEAGVSTAYTYDFRGLLTSVTTALATTQAVTTVYQYDEVGNEIQQTDAAGHSTTFQYDALGHRIGRTLPGGQSEFYSYDLAGNMVFQTNFNGVIITNKFDAMSRLTNRASAGGYQASFAYNPKNGLRTNMTDASGVTAYAYDTLNRLTNKTVTWASGPSASLNYAYDVTGLLTNLYDNVNGVANVYQYDILGRLTNVLAGGGLAATYGFDAVGNLQTTRYGNGVTNLYQYDSHNRLTNLVANCGALPIAQFAYTLGMTGNRAALQESVNSASRTYNWTYDLLYRLQQETMSGSAAYQTGYGYDLVGNRTNRTSTVSGANQSFAYNQNDWLTNRDNYDNNGNTINSLGNSYQYDALDHLTNANSGSIVMTYDGDGNRASKTANGSTTFYLLDEMNPSGYVQVLEEWTQTGTTVKLGCVYNYGLDLICQKRLLGIVRYFGHDGQGSTRFLTDINGNVTDTYTYDAYGNEIAAASTGASANTYLYTEQQWDADLGMYYLRARYYKPDLGRFWTRDSYEGNSNDPQSLHKYLYCQRNPVSSIDPSGHEEVVEVDVVNAISMGINAYSAASNIRAKRWGWAALDLISLGFGAGGMIGPGAIGQLASAEGVIASAAQLAAGIKGAKQVCQAWALVDLVMMMKSDNSDSSGDLSDDQKKLDPIVPNKLPATTEESVTDKLQRYLLNPDHVEGGPKAKWFKQALGFDRSNLNDLAKQIVWDEKAAIPTEDLGYGQKFEQIIRITGANGRVIDTPFVWIKNDDGVIRLVTGLPKPK